MLSTFCASAVIPFASCFYLRHFNYVLSNKTSEPCMHSQLNFRTYRVLFRTLNITTFAHLCTGSRAFYVCVLLCPTGMAAGECVCVCVCVCACWHAFCLYVDGVMGGLGFGHRGNKPVPGRKTASLLPPLFSLLPPDPSLFSTPTPTPNSHPQSSCLLIHLLCDDAPPAVGGCIPTKRKTAVVHEDGMFIEKKRSEMKEPFN